MFGVVRSNIIQHSSIMGVTTLPLHSEWQARFIILGLCQGDTNYEFIAKIMPVFFKSRFESLTVKRGFFNTKQCKPLNPV